jgi:Tfp pilus assembly protein PilP
MTAPVRLLVVLALVGAAVPAAAQAPAAQPAPQAPAAPAANATPKGPVLPSPPVNYVYAPEGRRDPFTNLVNRGADPRGTAGQSAKKPEGLAGLLTGEISVRGILQSRGVFVAMVAAPDGKVYTVKAGDKLLDGVVRTVTAQAVVILQEVNDPLSLEKQREVRKFLRGGEEVK